MSQNTYHSKFCLTTNLQQQRFFSTDRLQHYEFGFYIALLVGKLFWVMFFTPNQRFLWPIMIGITLLEFLVRYYPWLRHYQDHDPREPANKSCIKISPDYISPAGMIFATLSKASHTERQAAAYRPDHDFVLIHSLHSGKIFIQGGFTLASSTLLESPNYSQFLKSLAKMDDCLPLTIRQSIQNNGKSPILSTTILLTKWVLFPTKARVLNLVKKCDILAKSLLIELEKNFHHFRFAPMDSDALIREICHIHSPSQEIPSFHPKEGERQLLIMLSPMIFIGLLICFGISTILGQNLISRESNIIGMAIFGLSVLYLGFLIITRSLFWRFHKKPFILHSPLNRQSLQLDRITKSLTISHQDEDKIHRRYQYAFNLPDIDSLEGWNELYSQLLQELTMDHHRPTTRISAQCEIRLRRLVEGESVHYKSSFPAKFFQTKRRKRLDENEDSPVPEYSDQDKIYLQEKEVGGIFLIQPILTVTFHHTVDLKCPPKIATDTFEQLELERLQQLVKLALPNVSIRQVSGKYLSNGIIPNHYDQIFRNPIPMHLITGARLARFIRIPPEVCQFVQMHYPGKFYLPILDDSVQFGAALDSRRMTEGSIGGLDWEELRDLTLLTGDSDGHVFQGLSHIVQALVSRDVPVPVIIVDWDGQWNEDISRLKETIQHFRPTALIPYRNFGVNLFSLPGSLDALQDAQYFQRISALVGYLFQWSTEQCTLLRSAWGRLGAGSKQHLSFSAVQTNVGRLDEISQNSLHQQPAHEFLQFLGGDFHAGCFGTPMNQFFDFSAWIADPKPLLLDLSNFASDAYKSVFVHAVLLQLAFLMDNSSPDWTNFQSPVLVMDRAEMLYPAPAQALSHFSLSFHPEESLRHLISKGMGVVLGTEYLPDLHPRVVSRARAYFFFQTTHPGTVKQMSQLANFDPHFSSGYGQKQDSGSGSGSRSYQVETLKSLQPLHCIAYRRKVRFPYLFHFHTVVPPVLDEEMFEDGPETIYVFDETPECELDNSLNDSQADSQADSKADSQLLLETPALETLLQCKAELMLDTPQFVLCLQLLARLVALGSRYSVITKTRLRAEISLIFQPVAVVEKGKSPHDPPAYFIRSLQYTLEVSGYLEPITPAESARLAFSGLRVATKTREILAIVATLNLEERSRAVELEIFPRLPRSTQSDLLEIKEEC
ncbi:MAG: hypothetical protein ACTSRK_09955 [Promethearchaeota archaeon]